MAWFGFFKKKKKAKSPSSRQNGSRDGENPLLILLENYVLDCIGHLSKERSAEIGGLVRQVFGGGRDWKATLRSKLQLEDALDDYLRKQWKENQALARKANTKFSPEEYARMVVDENFADLCD